MTLILDPNDDKKLIWISKEYVIATGIPGPAGDVFGDITDPKILRGNGIYGSYGTLKLTVEEDPEGLFYLCW